MGSISIRITTLVLLLELLSLSTSTSIFSIPDYKSDRPQKFVFYSGADYSGREETFTTKEWDIQGHSSEIARTAKSVCVPSGVWVITANLTLHNGNDTEELFVRSTVNSNFGQICLSFHTESQSSKYLSIAYVASNDINRPAISFYNQNNFFGQELYLDGTEVRLHKPILVKSFAFTGAESWTIYSGTDFNGTEYCVKAHMFDGRLLGVTGVHEYDDEVGSVKMGCDDTKLFLGDELYDRKRWRTSDLNAKYEVLVREDVV